MNTIKHIRFAPLLIWLVFLGCLALPFSAMGQIQTTISITPPAEASSITGKTLNIQFASFVNGVPTKVGDPKLIAPLTTTGKLPDTLFVTLDKKKDTAILAAARNSILVYHTWLTPGGTEPDDYSYVVPGTPSHPGSGASVASKSVASIATVSGVAQMSIDTSAIVDAANKPIAAGKDIFLKFTIASSVTGTVYDVKMATPTLTIKANDTDVSSGKLPFSELFQAASANTIFFTVSSDNKTFTSIPIVVAGTPYSDEHFPRALKITPDLFGAISTIDPGNFSARTIGSKTVIASSKNSSGEYGSSIVLHAVLGRGVPLLNDLLGHDVWGSNSDAYWGVSLGIPIISTGAQSTPSAFLTGITFYMGDPDKRPCAAITIGAAFLQATRLAAGYHVGDAIAPGASVPTTTAWKCGLGLGVAYSVPLK